MGRIQLIVGGSKNAHYQQVNKVCSVAEQVQKAGDDPEGELRLILLCGTCDGADKGALNLIPVEGEHEQDMQVDNHTEDIEGQDHLGIVIRSPIDYYHDQLIQLDGKLAQYVQECECIECDHEGAADSLGHHYLACTQTQQTHEYPYLKSHQAHRCHDQRICHVYL